MGETTNEVRSIDELKRASVQPGGAEGELGSSAGTTEIRQGIERTRTDLSATIDALQEKLDPSRIAEQVKDQIREKATEAYDTAKTAVKEATVGRVEKFVASVGETVSEITGQASTAVSDSSSSVVQYIRENPVPLALVGIGLGMLAMSKRRVTPATYSTGGQGGPTFGAYGQDAGSGITETARGAAASVVDTAKSLADRTTGVVSSAAGSVRGAAASAAETTRLQFQNVSSQAQQSARATSDRFQGTLESNPLAVGIAALAAGALLGLTLPSTEIEGQYMGEAKERLVDQAKSLAQDAADKVGRVAQEAGHTFQDAAKKEGLVGS